MARAIWADMLSIAVTYFITLCLFPGLESEVRHCVLGEWLPILIMAVFNLSDFVGKVSLQPAPGGGDGAAGSRVGTGQPSHRAIPDRIPPPAAPATPQRSSLLRQRLVPASSSCLCTVNGPPGRAATDSSPRERPPLGRKNMGRGP